MLLACKRAAFAKKNAKRAISMVNKGNLNAEEERFQRWMVLPRKRVFRQETLQK